MQNPGTSKGRYTTERQGPNSYTANRDSFDEDQQMMTDPGGNIDFCISYRGPQAAWARWINWVVRTSRAGEGKKSRRLVES